MTTQAATLRLPRRAHLRPRVLHLIEAGPHPGPGLLDAFVPPRSAPDAFVRACALAVRRHAGARHTALLLASSAGERAAHAMGLRTFDRIVPRAGVCPARRVRVFLEHAGPFDVVKAWSADAERIVRRAAPAAQLLRAPLEWNPQPAGTQDWETSAATEDDSRPAARRALRVLDTDLVIALFADPPDSAAGFEAQRLMATLDSAGLTGVGVMPSQIRGRDRALRQARAHGLRRPLLTAPTTWDALAGADIAVILPILLAPPPSPDAALARAWWEAEALDRGIPLVTTLPARADLADPPGVVRLAPDATAHDLAAAIISMTEAPRGASRRSERAEPDRRALLLRHLFFR